MELESNRYLISKPLTGPQKVTAKHKINLLNIGSITQRSITFHKYVIIVFFIQWGEGGVIGERLSFHNVLYQVSTTSLKLGFWHLYIEVSVSRTELSH